MRSIFISIISFLIILFVWAGKTLPQNVTNPSCNVKNIQQYRFFGGQRIPHNHFLGLQNTDLLQRMQKSGYQIKTIVIDAGHGGRDPGTLGLTTQEKTVTLSLALQVGRYLNNNYPNINVVYTRTGDEFVPLYQRAEIANRNQADLFISIHCNSVPKKPKAYGTETYVMGLNVEEENLQIAKRENSVILLEDNYQKRYAGYDPNSEEGHILTSMFQDAYLEQSINLAVKVEDSFVEDNRKSRGVKQAGFVVLRATSMPSILIETGFLSNKGENQFLTSTTGQSKIAYSIFRAIENYKNTVETPSDDFVAGGIGDIMAQVASDINLNDETPAQKGYKILLTTADGKLPQTDTKWQKVKNLQVKEGRFTEYFSTGYKTLEEAEADLIILKEAGFKYAQVVK